MFTGIVEERGVVRATRPHGLVIGCRNVVGDSDVGASIAVNGVCLTVVERTTDSLAFDVSEETIARTSLSKLSVGDPVNLERASTLMSRLGGHLVQGHVDGIGEVVEVRPDDAGGAWLTVRVPGDLLRYLVEKGSVSVDGISLTIAALAGCEFSVALIPHTLAATNLGAVAVGDHVNLEVDVIAKYVERLLGADAAPGRGATEGVDT
jgi:riboflavin synthase